jgi:uncharacterized protein HemX
MFGLSAVEVGALAVAAVGAGSAVYSAKQGQIAQKNAGQAAVAAANKNAQSADEANNAANAKSPDSAALMAANLAAGKQGASGTMLTGPGGVDPTALTLGKSSLLGG